MEPAVLSGPGALRCAAACPDSRLSQRSAFSPAAESARNLVVIAGILLSIQDVISSSSPKGRFQWLQRIGEGPCFRHRNERAIACSLKVLESEVSESVFEDLVAGYAVAQGSEIAAHR